MPAAPPAPNLPAPPATGTMSEGASILVGPEVSSRIISLVIENSAFGDALTQMNTSAGSVAFGTADPSGADWVPELGAIPEMDAGLGAVVVVLRKLAGICDISRELVADSTFNVTAELSRILKDSLSAQLDQGILYGEGGDTGPAPQGIVAGAEAVSSDGLGGLFDAAVKARGAIIDAGGQPDRLAASGAALAAADTQRDTSGQLVYPGGIGAALGLEVRPVPGLADALVFDSSRCYLAVNTAMSTVEVTDLYRWRWDAWSVKVRIRAAAVVPDPAKGIRRLVIGNGNGGSGAEAAQPASATRAPRTPRASKS